MSSRRSGGKATIGWSLLGSEAAGEVLAGQEAFIKPSGRGQAEDQEAGVFMSHPTGPRNPSPLAGSPKPLSAPPGLIRPSPRLGGVVVCLRH